MSCKDFVMHSRVKECSSIIPTEIAAFLSGIDCDCWPIIISAPSDPACGILPRLHIAAGLPVECLELVSGVCAEARLGARLGLCQWVGSAVRNRVHLTSSQDAPKEATDMRTGVADNRPLHRFSDLP
jgi:hypothetical protein